MASLEVGNDKVRLVLAIGPSLESNVAFGQSIHIESIDDLVGGASYRASGGDLFEYAVNNGPPRTSGRDLAVTDVEVTEPGRTVRVRATDSGSGLEFEVDIVADGDEPAVLVGLRITRVVPGPSVFVRMVFPKLLGLSRSGTTDDLTDGWGMVSTEIGSIVRLADVTGQPGNGTDGVFHPGMIGKPFIGDALRVGLPIRMNTMELASFYFPDGGGLFVADVDHDLDSGKAAVQFTMPSSAITGFWVSELQAGIPVETPTLAFGVHPAGDWHNAVDYYRAKRRAGSQQSPHQPAWFADQAAIYTHSGGGAGGMYLSNTMNDLTGQLNSFRDLPLLLNDARSLGTDIVYLWDYWDGPHAIGDASARLIARPRPPYFNKGDYLPRADLGGEDAFRGCPGLRGT